LRLQFARSEAICNCLFRLCRMRNRVDVVKSAPRLAILARSLWQLSGLRRGGQWQRARLPRVRTLIAAAPDDATLAYMAGGHWRTSSASIPAFGSYLHRHCSCEFGRWRIHGRPGESKVAIITAFVPVIGNYPKCNNSHGHAREEHWPTGLC
jgi:hypothetical protein